MKPEFLKENGSISNFVRDSRGSSDSEHPVNEAIRAPRVRLVGPDGEILGVFTRSAALQKAQEYGLDLVEVASQAEPPVCKLLDYGKFRYEAQKKKHEAKKKQKVIEVKELKLRPVTDLHDLNIKLKAARGFLTEGNKVKFTIRFRGRELSHQQLGQKILDHIKTDLDDVMKVEFHPRLEGRQMIMIIAPK